jgi:hypothetical protein
MRDLTEPEHVHIGEGNSKSASDAKIWLRDLSVATPGRFNEHRLGTILKIVEENQERWLEIWRQYAENQR